MSSDSIKKPEFEKHAATLTIGSITDGDFLTETFTGASAVYAMPDKLH